MCVFLSLKLSCVVLKCELCRWRHALVAEDCKKAWVSNCDYIEWKQCLCGGNIRKSRMGFRQRAGVQAFFHPWAWVELGTQIQRPGRLTLGSHISRSRVKPDLVEKSQHLWSVYRRITWNGMRDYGLEAWQAVPVQVNILLNTQVAIRDKRLANRFFFLIVYGIFL